MRKLKPNTAYYIHYVVQYIMIDTTLNLEYITTAPVDLVRGTSQNIALCIHVPVGVVLTPFNCPRYTYRMH